MRRLCSTVCELTDISLIMDLTYSGWGVVKKFCELSGIHYIRFDVTIQPYLNMVVDFLENLRNSTDATFVFDTVIGQRQGLSYLLRNSRMRISTFAALTNDVIRSLRTRNPYPTFIVLVGEQTKLQQVFLPTIAKENLIKTDESLVLLPTNMLSVKIKMPKTFAYNVTIFQTQQSLCCYLQENTRTCTCNLMSKFQLLTALISKYANVLNKMLTDLNKSNFLNPRDIHCQVEEDGALTVPDMDVKDRKPLNHLYVFQALQNNPPLMFSENTSLISYKLDLNMSTWIAPNRSLIQLGTYNTQNGFNTSRSVEKIPRYFRIGSVVSIPWTMPVRDPLTGYIMRDYQDREMYQGYCIDLINELAKTMNFQYELVIASRFGKKLANNSWTGLVGMLMRGKIDIAVAALTMTAEREEVLDYVTPYFDQTGITIVIRKPIPKTSLFKFMTVLKSEVWLSIVGALVITGIMIWLLDTYSPYSAQNNPQVYPPSTRIFTLKESIWFALTSFTPQGGGEAPKALSGRTLVAAYWLFVVLMLATFTANLAAFLTVERMQSPVQSLEQLARQSRINYTVVDNSNAHEYFKNMKHAEDIIYRVWKEITLNASNDQKKFRVWDYPVKEQYGQILEAIEKTGPVPDAKTGFDKVLESEQGEFALIHDSAEIKYEVSKNCNLTEVGELFAEQPYSIAVQQGSELAIEISSVILDLQSDRYFEFLDSKYWNSTLKNEQCANDDESEGITLESLGGVFIATLFGLALAMITLVLEIFYHQKNRTRHLKEPLTPGNIRPRPTLKVPKPKFKPQKSQNLLLGSQKRFEQRSLFGALRPKTTKKSMKAWEKVLTETKESSQKVESNQDGFPNAFLYANDFGGAHRLQDGKSKYARTRFIKVLPSDNWY
ncbi:hypothetical protein M8J77_008175 [Diaphorina citri]|nr:hypothetical protein M8J77_008175 [Diaphorina citri]